MRREAECPCPEEVARGVRREDSSSSWRHRTQRQQPYIIYFFYGWWWGTSRLTPHASRPKILKMEHKKKKKKKNTHTHTHSPPHTHTHTCGARQTRTVCPVVSRLAGEHEGCPPLEKDVNASFFFFFLFLLPTAVSATQKATNGGLLLPLARPGYLLLL